MHPYWQWIRSIVLVVSTSTLNMEFWLLKHQSKYAHIPFGKIIMVMALDCYFYSLKLLQYIWWSARHLLLTMVKRYQISGKSAHCHFRTTQWVFLPICCRWLRWTAWTAWSATTWTWASPGTTPGSQPGRASTLGPGFLSTPTWGISSSNLKDDYYLPFSIVLAPPPPSP